jgi:hypothetical protein
MTKAKITDPTISLKEKTTLLKEYLQLLLKTNKFEVGQIVKWKKGSQNSLQNKEFPLDDQEAIVVSVLDKPFEDNQSECDSPYFKEQLDLILGLVDKDGDFITCYFDSRRFEPVKNSDD